LYCGFTILTTKRTIRGRLKFLTCSRPYFQANKIVKKPEIRKKERKQKGNTGIKREINEERKPGRKKKHLNTLFLWPS